MTQESKLFPRVARGIALGLVAGVLAFVPTVHAQKAYPSPDAAAEAFIDGLGRNDDAVIRTVLGPTWKKFVPTETSISGEDITNFLEAWSKGHRIVPKADDKAFLEVGTHGWTLPIPIVKNAEGWHFDIKAAPDEMRTRRIGRNELDAIQVVLTIGDAQRDYAKYSRAHGGVVQYAQKILSSPGKRDGLYWPVADDEDPSPLGLIAADAKVGVPYHGYYFRIVTAQGKDAPGGAKSYIVNGQMTGGYAIVGWPAKWGDTGVMTFIGDASGVVYQKDLGASTDAIAKAMQAYDPDATWKKAQ